MADSVEVLFYGGLGGACYLGDLGVGEVVEVEEEEFLFVVGQLVDEVVEVFASWVGFFGEGVGEVLVKGYEFVSLFLFAFAQFHACGVEGYAVDPGGGVAFAAEFRPSTPEVADDFLVEVVDIVRLPVGESKICSNSVCLVSLRVTTLSFSFVFLYTLDAKIRKK